MNIGAIGVQRLFRGKLGRRRVALMRNRETELLRHAGALCIQRVYRGYLGRRMVKDRLWRRIQTEKMRVATQFIRLWRGFMGRRAFFDERDRQESDVFTQARRGNHQKVKDLLAGFGTSIVYTVNSMDDHGNTVLLTAARWGHKKIVRHCLRIQMQIDHVNDAGKTAVELAVVNGHADVAEYLISKVRASSRLRPLPSRCCVPPPSLVPVPVVTHPPPPCASCLVSRVPTGGVAQLLRPNAAARGGEAGAHQHRSRPHRQQRAGAGAGRGRQRRAARGSRQRQAGYGACA